MSNVNSINSVGSSLTKSGSSNNISTEDFLKIMIEQLQKQDPFEPTSAKDLIDQIGHITDIQSNLSLVDTLKDLAINQKISAASALIGRLVVGINSEGEEVSGIVNSVVREGDDVFLELDSGARLSIDNIIAVYKDNH